MNSNFGAPLYESFQDNVSTQVDNMQEPNEELDEGPDGPIGPAGSVELEGPDEPTGPAGSVELEGPEEPGCSLGYYRGEDTDRGYECIGELDQGEAGSDAPIPTEPTTVSGEEPTTSSMETFVGNNGNNGKVLNLNLFLKSLLFSCLFYLLAHTDTKFAARKAVSSILNLKKARYLYFATAIFFVVYYVLNLLI